MSVIVCGSQWLPWYGGCTSFTGKLWLLRVASLSDWQQDRIVCWMFNNGCHIPLFTAMGFIIFEPDREVPAHFTNVYFATCALLLARVLLSSCVYCLPTLNVNSKGTPLTQICSLPQIYWNTQIRSATLSI